MQKNYFITIFHRLSTSQYICCKPISHAVVFLSDMCFSMLRNPIMLSTFMLLDAHNRNAAAHKYLQNCSFATNYKREQIAMHMLGNSIVHGPNSYVSASLIHSSAHTFAIARCSCMCSFGVHKRVRVHTQYVFVVVKCQVTFFHHACA